MTLQAKSSGTGNTQPQSAAPQNGNTKEESPGRGRNTSQLRDSQSVNSKGKSHGRGRNTSQQRDSHSVNANEKSPGAVEVTSSSTPPQIQATVVPPVVPPTVPAATVACSHLCSQHRRNADPETSREQICGMSPRIANFVMLVGGLFALYQMSTAIIGDIAKVTESQRLQEFQSIIGAVVSITIFVLLWAWDSVFRRYYYNRRNQHPD